MTTALKTRVLSILGLTVLVACTQSPAIENEPQLTEASDTLPNQLDTPSVVSSENESEESAGPMYQVGRHYLKLDKGSIVLVIQPKTDTSCRFVFDTGAKTPYYAKLAGDLIVNREGKSTYTGPSCKALNFHFTEGGISVKEYKCSQFHSGNIAFDGLYTLEKPMSDNPKVLLNELQQEEQLFDFYASFTEPFWTLYFLGDQILFNQIDEDPKLFKLDHAFDPTKAKQTLHFSTEHKQWEAVIEKGEGSNGMSDIVYPYSIILNGEHYGGGATEFQHDK